MFKKTAKQKRARRRAVEKTTNEKEEVLIYNHSAGSQKERLEKCPKANTGPGEQEARRRFCEIVKTSNVLRIFAEQILDDVKLPK